MTKNLKYIALCLLVTLLASACSKDGADSNEVTNRNEAKKEIGIKPDVWKMAEATRATTYDNTALQSDGFTVYAYTAESITPYKRYRMMLPIGLSPVGPIIGQLII